MEQTMSRHPLARNAPCPWGRKYKQCCWNKEFQWTVDEAGRISRAAPLPAEAAAVLEQQRQKFRKRFGRDMGPEDLLFFDAPPREHVEHQLALAMKQARLNPAFIHVFEQTGLLVSEDNQHLIPDVDLARWHAAVADYRARQDGGD
jgi:hypothetical protein